MYVLSIYVERHTYIFVYTYISIYLYIYRERERGKGDSPGIKKFYQEFPRSLYLQEILES